MAISTSRAADDKDSSKLHALAKLFWRYEISWRLRRKNTTTF